MARIDVDYLYGSNFCMVLYRVILPAVTLTKCKTSGKKPPEKMRSEKCQWPPNHSNFVVVPLLPIECTYQQLKLIDNPLCS